MLFYYGKIHRMKDEDSKVPKLELEGEYEYFVLDASFSNHTVKSKKRLIHRPMMKILGVLVQFKDIFS